MTSADGSQTDVRLGRDFKVVSEEADHESNNETGESGSQPGN